MNNAIDLRFSEWIEGKSQLEARIHIFERIRDIPYAIVPELISAEHYHHILTLGKGSCTPKHLLLTDMFQRLGITVLLAVYPFRWAEVKIDLPHYLKARANSLPPDHHLACKAEIHGKLVLVDATIDPPLEGLGLPINKTWDGCSDTLLPIEPSGDETIYHPSEARRINTVFIDKAHLTFFHELNTWLDKFRNDLASEKT